MNALEFNFLSTIAYLLGMAVVPMILFIRITYKCKKNDSIFKVQQFQCTKKRIENILYKLKYSNDYGIIDGTLTHILKGYELKIECDKILKYISEDNYNNYLIEMTTHNYLSTILCLNNNNNQFEFLY